MKGGLRDVFVGKLSKFSAERRPVFAEGLIIEDLIF